MKKSFILIIISIFITVSCQTLNKTTIPAWIPYDESEEIAENSEHESKKMQFQLIQSKVSDKNDIWKNVTHQVKDFSDKNYLTLSPLILEQDIPTLQSHIQSGKITYKRLTQWYLYRIVKFENDRHKYLNAIISINPNAVKEAEKKDKNKSKDNHLIFGMPILLKDNVNFSGLPTTAGAVALLENHASDAFIVEKIKEKGGIILGKANLSEWANFLSPDCPNGYSAVGGQTLNPYDHKQFDTGGSSSGSGVSMAANYAVAAVGTETSGSILSPASSNSIVGLKPTVGLLSRSGIVPISSTLDTPGPMTRNVVDNAILLSAMSGEDENDPITKNNPKNLEYWKNLESSTLDGFRFGVIIEFLEDSIYKLNVEKIKSLGGITIEFEPENMDFDGFLTLLNGDMKVDLPKYIADHGSENITFKSVKEIFDFNLEDSLLRIPYGQGRFSGIIDEDIEETEFAELKSRLYESGVNFFENAMQTYQLDAILSINNWNAGNAALAKYPCLTIPMGYEKSGKPIGITFIVRPFEEEKLLKMGYAFEQATKSRKLPKNY